MEELSKDDLEKIYLVLKMIKEELLRYSEEGWEEDYYGEEILDRKEFGKLLVKVKKLIPAQELKEVDKTVLRRKYSTFQDNVDPSVQSKLNRAYQKKVSVILDYFSLERGEAVRRKVDPYYKNSKYLVAFCHLRKDMRKFRISRIVKAKLTGEGYKVPESFNRKEYV